MKRQTNFTHKRKIQVYYLHVIRRMSSINSTYANTLSELTAQSLDHHLNLFLKLGRVTWSSMTTTPHPPAKQNVILKIYKSFEGTCCITPSFSRNFSRSNFVVTPTQSIPGCSHKRGLVKEEINRGPDGITQSGLLDPQPFLVYGGLFSAENLPTSSGRFL